MSGRRGIIPTTRSVTELYERYPFPHSRVLPERLPAIFCLDELFLGLGSRAELAGARVLDIGCGTGEATLSCARAFPEMHFVGVDLSTRALEAAIELARAHGIENTTFTEGDAMSPATLPAGPFDAAVARGSIHHFADPVEGLRNVVRALRPGGMLAMALYNPHGRRDWERLRRAMSLLNAGPDEEGVAMTRSLIELFSDGPRSFLAYPFFGMDSFVTDSFLHPNLHEFELDTVAPLLDGAGLIMRRVLLNDWETPHQATEDPRQSYVLPEHFPAQVQERLGALPQAQRDRFMELLLRPSLFQVYAQRPPVTEARPVEDPSSHRPLRASFVRLKTISERDAPARYEVVLPRERTEVEDRDYHFLEAATGKLNCIELATDIYGEKQAKSALNRVSDWARNGWLYLLPPIN